MSVIATPRRAKGISAPRWRGHSSRLVCSITRRPCIPVTRATRSPADGRPPDPLNLTPWPTEAATARHDRRILCSLLLRFSRGANPMVKRQRGTPTAISSGYLRTGRLWGSRAAGTGLASPLIIRQSCPFTFFAIERAISRISASRFVQVVSSLALSNIRSQCATMTASLLVRSCAKTQCLPESSLCLSMSYHPSKSISEMIRGYVSGTLRQQSQRSVTAVTSNSGPVIQEWAPA